MRFSELCTFMGGPLLRRGMTTYAYTLSSAGAMFQRAFFSIQTLIQYADPENIVVFFTPPRDPSHVSRLKSLGVDVRTVDNDTEAFTAFDTPRHYGEKTLIRTLSDDTVVFLDCDTLILGNIRRVIQGDFQFKARPGTSQVRQPAWQGLFKRFDEQYLDWMPNAGFLVFKNGYHREIGPKWHEYVGTKLSYRHGVNHKEQYALALAVGGGHIEKMTPEEHVMLWNEEYPEDGIVYHIGKTIEQALNE